MRKILLFFLSIFTLNSFAQLGSSPNPSSVLLIKPSANQGKDASIWSNNGNGNYGNGNNNVVYTWTNQGRLGIRRALYEFDLSLLPRTAQIDSVKMKLYYDPTNIHNFQTHSGSNVMEVKRITSSWDEATVTWNNQPSTTNTNMLIVPSFVSNVQDYYIDVSVLVKDMILNTNHGFLIKMQDEVNYYKSTVFASTEHPDSTLHPELIIHYHLSTGLKSKDKILSDLLNVYPNPSTGIINFKFENNNKLSDFQVSITDITGKQMKVESLDSKIDLSSFSKGVYFLKLLNNSNEVYLKRITLF